MVSPLTSSCHDAPSCVPLTINLGTKSQDAVDRRVLPWQVCAAVTDTIWDNARHAAANVHKAADGVEDAPGRNESSSSLDASDAAPSPKRRRHQLVPLSESVADMFPSVSSSQPSQFSQSQSQSTVPTGPVDNESCESTTEAQRLLRVAWEKSGRKVADIPEDAWKHVHKMQLAASAYWNEATLDLSKAATSLARFLEHQRRLFWKRESWRGVNLGGWLLLEPGPSYEFFEKYGGSAGCEWDILSKMHAELGDEGVQKAVQMHRDRHITEDDFRCIRALGLNAVRIPFGYWIATGPAQGDPYVGPGLEYLDRALAWCETYGLQALLDLHGAPGGESGEKPCGRERKDWHWQEWRFDESVAALKIIAARYKGHPAVAGISVCNEPSDTVPAIALCQFYDNAIKAIRDAGMPPDEVAIVLPVYRIERLDQIWKIWACQFDGFLKHANIAFDLHLYHCFGTWWQRQGLGEQLKMTRRHRKILRRFPSVVGEWSLALAPNARGEQSDEDRTMRAFASAQLEAYSQASHGWFFWTWRDSPTQLPDWDLRRCLAKRWITKPELSSAGLASRTV